MSLSLGSRARIAWPGAKSADRRPSLAVPAEGARAPDPGGGLRPVSLRFRDAALERRYQREAGAESVAGFRITTATAATMWLLAAAFVPAGTPIPAERALPVGLAMALFNALAFAASGWARTLDRQHSIVSVLTGVNSVVILWFASTGGVLAGYGISAIMLLFIFGFVSRTGFVFAAARSVVIVVAFAAFATSYAGRGRMLVDSFIFGAAVIGVLVALRLLEQSRRRVFYQEIVINEQAGAVRVEKQRADALLLELLPPPISARLLDGERTIADEYPVVTVLFADIAGFTSIASRLPAAEVIELLGRLFGRFDELVAARRLEKIKTIGDAYMVAGGLFEPLDDQAVRAVDLGLAMLEVAREEASIAGGIRLRVGVHSGPVIGGVIGRGKSAFDIWGDTVNVASRLESQGTIGRVQVSDATWRQLEDRFEAEPCGPIDLRGHAPVETYLVTGRRRPGLS